MQKRKIIVFTTAYHPIIGGVETSIKESVSRLGDEFDFVIVTSRFRRDLPRREIRMEGEVVRLGFGSSLDKWLLPFFGLWFVYRHSKKLSDFLLWGMDISQGSVAALLVKFFYPRIPFFLTIQYGYGGGRIDTGRWGIIGFVFRMMLKRANGVSALSRYLKDLVISYGYKKEVLIIPNGVDIQKFSAGGGSDYGGKSKNEKLKVEDRDTKVVVTTGRLVEKNGVDILIRAIAEVKKTIPDITCKLIGDGPDRADLEALALELGVEDAVQFVGDVPLDEVPKYLHAADVFVRPSRTEGMGASFVEALAAGIPIIGTPVEGIPDIIEDEKTGLFTRVDDPKDLAEKILRLLQDQKFSESIVKHGQRMVQERFSWDMIAERYRRALKQTIKL